MNASTPLNPVVLDLQNKLLRLIRSETYISPAVDLMLEHGIRYGASDLILDPCKDSCMALKYRMNGLIQEVCEFALEDSERIISRVKVLAGIPVYIRGLPLDGRISLNFENRSVEIRAAIIPTVKGERAVLRFLDPLHLFKPLPELGFEESLTDQLEKIIETDQGLIVICGACSSGKTTTMYAILDRIAQKSGKRRQIILVEDPVEYRLDKIAQVEVNESVGLDFETALRAILRQDPEVIGIGEIRDAETARIAVRAALTGHLVIATVHCGSPEEAPGRIRELGVDRRLLAGSLSAILWQELTPVACPDCNGDGCLICMHLGIVGRAARGRLLIPDDSFRQTIIERTSRHD